jgi:hypothetical protein
MLGPARNQDPHVKKQNKTNITVAEGKSGERFALVRLRLIAIPGEGWAETCQAKTSWMS